MLRRTLPWHRGVPSLPYAGGRDGEALMERIGHYIGGKHVLGSSGRRGPVFDPATGEQIKIPARTAIKITPAKALKDTFNKKGKK